MPFCIFMDNSAILEKTNGRSSFFSFRPPFLPAGQLHDYTPELSMSQSCYVYDFTSVPSMSISHSFCFKFMHPLLVTSSYTKPITFYSCFMKFPSFSILLACKTDDILHVKIKIKYLSTFSSAQIHLCVALFTVIEKFDLPNLMTGFDGRSSALEPVFERSPAAVRPGFDH